MTILAPEESTDNKVEDIAIIGPNKIIINPEYENLVPQISDSEFEGTEFDPYRQMGVSGDTLEIYNDLIANDRRLRREKGLGESRLL